jgi:mono/diheme cytochrome c family protein
MNLSIKKVKTMTITVFSISSLAMVVLFSNPSGAVDASQDDAGKLFKAKCAVCHSADGSGNSPMGKNLKIRDLRSAEVQKQSDAQLSEIISKGKGKMPSFEKSLGKEQIRDLVGYIRGLAKKR